MKKRIALLILFVSLVLLGCTHKTSSFSDDRFSANAVVKNNKIVITFTSVPTGSAYIKDAQLYKEDNEGNSEWIGKCSLSQSHVGKDVPINAVCPIEGKGKYYIRLHLKHIETSSYKPVNGETCLKYNNGNWECESGGEVYFVVE